MNKRYKKIINISIFVLVVCFVSINIGEFSSLSRLTIQEISSLVIVLLLFFITTGVTFALLVNLVGIQLSKIEIVGLSFLTNMVNYLAPLRPGAAVKAMYLKSVKDLEYSRFSSVLAANAFLALGTTSGVAIILLIHNWYFHDFLPIELLAISLVLCLLSMSPFVVKSFSWITPTGKSKFSVIVNNAIFGFEQIRENRMGILLVCTSLIIQFMLAGMLMYLVFGSIGIELTYRMALLLGVFTALANLFTVTPNNMGVQEAVIGYLIVVVGEDFNQGIVGAALLRTIHIALTFLIGSLFVQRMLIKADLSITKMMPR